ncbi:MAG: serine/threonine protein kinase [Planctomycetes bacterium]|nr:serine/threonine protein kinase [Planctomycetota bacterium]
MPDPADTLLLHLFERALELPPAARRAFLDGKCRQDPGLRHRLQAMLAAAGDPQFQPTPAEPPRAPSTPPSVAPEATAPLREGPGTRIGPYKLLQLIGEGGFGAVFLAEQEQPVARRVALKIIKLGMDTRQVVARFEQERQALAMMDHPNIARVLDAGATETGRPYFVMDLVKGEPIVEYCDKNHLTITERLELFEQVCGAVQHAHAKGIIHRDLKPSNVMVGMQDGRPSAKVIDFGIAKATSTKLTEKTLFTEQQQVVGTLQYMSPEQAEGSLDIDTRSDVYALGVLLYELLTGTTPFGQDTFRDVVLSEIQRRIREVDPPRPSTRLHESGATLPSIAAHRRTEPRTLGSLLRGDLDWIVMKALEKDRARRYQTANGLAMDVRRHLAGEAVVAAPPSAAYRLRKFVRRNRGTVAAAGAVVAALMAGVAGFAWQAHIAERERDVALAARRAEAEARGTADRLAESENKQRLAAESSARKADAINRFLLEMLGSANVRELGREAKVAQALDRAAAGVGKAFVGDPEVEAAVRQILGRSYLSLGLLDAAETQIRAGLDLQARGRGAGTLDYARGLSDLGEWQRQKAQLEAAAESCRRAAGIALQVEGPEDETTLRMQVEYANALVAIGRAPEAETILRANLATMTRVLGRERQSTLVVINSLAVLLHQGERLDEAEPLYREAAELGARVLGPEHVDTLTARMNLASVLCSRRRYEEAETLMAATFAALKRAFGDAHTKTAEAAASLALLYFDQGKPKEALPLYEETIAIRRRAQGDQTVSMALVKAGLARTLSQLGDDARACDVLRQVVDTRTALLGAEHQETISGRLDLANTLVRANRKAEGETLLKELLVVCPRALGEDHSLTIIATNSHAVLLLGLDRFAEAEPYLRKALAAGRRTEGADSRSTIITQLNLVGALSQLDRLGEAEELGRDALQRFLKVFGPQHPNSAVARSKYADVLAKLGRKDEARRELVEAIAVRKAAMGEKHPAYSGDAVTLTGLLLDAGQTREAETLAREAVDVRSAAYGADDRRTARARLELGRCLAQAQRYAEAEPVLLESHARLVATAPAGHKEIRTAERYLAECYKEWNAAEPDGARAAKADEWQRKAEATR